MRKLVLIAAMLMASASAHAGSISFKVEGQKVRVDIPRGCASLSCINFSAPGLADKFKDKDEKETTTTATAPAPAPVQQTVSAAPVAPAAPVAQAAPAAPAPMATAPEAASRVTVLPAPTTAPAAETTAAPVISAPQPTLQPPPIVTAAPVAAPAPAPVQVAVAPAATPAATPVAAPAATPSEPSPVGLWLSEKKEGKIRVEACGTNICGYAVNEKTGQNGTQILINMKPKGDKWAGRIHDPRGGGNYDSTITLRGNDKLKVSGCMFGFCSGETWTRIQ